MSKVKIKSKRLRHRHYVMAAAWHEFYIRKLLYKVACNEKKIAANEVKIRHFKALVARSQFQVVPP